MAATRSIRWWHWLRFSLRELMGLTAFVLVGLMSLMHATSWMPNFWFTALLLSIAIAGAFWRAGKQDGLAEGYVLFAGGYALILVSAWTQVNPFMTSPNSLHNFLLTNSLNNWAYERVLPRIRQPPPESAGGSGGGFFGPGPIGQFGGMAPRGGGGMGGGGMRARSDEEDEKIEGFPSNLSIILGGGQSLLEYPDLDNFQRVAHCLWGVAMGCLGGRFMQALRTPASSVERTSVRS